MCEFERAPIDKEQSIVWYSYSLQCVPVHFSQPRVTECRSLVLRFAVCKCFVFAYCGHHSTLTLCRLRYFARESHFGSDFNFSYRKLVIKHIHAHLLASLSGVLVRKATIKCTLFTHSHSHVSAQNSCYIL